MAEVREAGALVRRSSPRPWQRILLLFLLFAIPSAWVFEQVVNYAFASYACFPRDYPRFHVMPAWNWTWGASIVINGLALLSALTLIALSVARWRASSEQDPSSHDDVMEKGEGTGKYLELCGYLIGGGFFAVIAFNLIVLILVPMCQK
jgi:hypothetical protein